MPAVDEAVLKTRVLIWEHLYTLFESFALCWRLEERFNELKEVTSPQVYADNLNDWIAFYAHLGRIHDMAEKVAKGWFKDDKGVETGGGLYTPFDSFYEKRHTVLHYPKVPMKFADNVLLAPTVGEASKDWRQGMLWSELKPENFEFLASVIGTTLRELEKVTDKFLFRITELARTQQGFKDVRWPEPAPKADKTSPLTDQNISGFNGSPPSGAYFDPPRT
jgi:hypothetical protein